VLVKAKEKAICEKAAELWGQALDEGYEETTDNSGLTIDIFKGAHYALGALKGFWSPSKQGFVVINKAIADLERLLSDEEDEIEETTSHQSAESQKQKVNIPALPAPEETPDSRVKWRITRTDDGDDGYIYTTEGVNGYSVRKFYEETQPGKLIEMDGQRVLPGEVPLSATFEDDNISDALFHWIDGKYSFEFIQDQTRSFDYLLEFYDDISEIFVCEFEAGKPVYATSYRLEEYGYDFLVCFNEILEYAGNFKMIFLEHYV